MDFSCLDRFSRPPSVVTFFRDPVDRSISTYYWFKQREDAPHLRTLGARQRQIAKVIEACRSLELSEFLDQCPELVDMFLRNHQTRVLAGHDPLINPTSVPDIELLDRAKANLIRCRSVGLVERFGDSVDLMSDALGLGPLGTPQSMNVTRFRPLREELPTDVLAELERITPLDAELYRTAQARFERDLLSRVEPRTPNETSTAIPSDVFQFDRAFHGDGWYAPERTSDGWVCWLGPECEAWLEFSRPTPGVRLARLDVAHAASKEILNSVEVCANGHPLALNFKEARSGCAIEAGLPEAVLAADFERLRISIRVCRTEVPKEGDTRSLGIALRRIQLLQAP